MAEFPTPQEMPADRLVQFDREHLWHPYASVPSPTAPYVVRSAEGVRLRIAIDDRDVEVIDAMSSWWAAIHGYRHPRLDAAAHRQLDRMSHVMFGGLTHQPAVELGQRLIELLPSGLKRVFFCDSGSVSVEVAMKMALQYWASVGQPAKRRFLTWRGGYHGDTFHPMSVCDPEGGMHRHWAGVLPDQLFVDAPPAGFESPVDTDYLDRLDAKLKRHRHEVAAILVEPVVQGAGRMDFHNPGYLSALREAADRHDVLLIFDEIATGFGRTGAMFAAEHAGVSPDIMCIGKALTGGYLTMAATICTERVAEGIARGELPVLAHGPTFMANPLACSVACASIDELQASDWRTQVARVEQGLRTGLGSAQDLAGVAEVRVLGAIGVIEMTGEVDVPASSAAAMRRGVWIRPFRNLLYTMPPYVTEDEDMEQITAALVAAAAVPTLG
jgi:adenosylmethionine-8-amino-7-oxononanoate aminotransferase